MTACGSRENSLQNRENEQYTGTGQTTALVWSTLEWTCTHAGPWGHLSGQEESLTGGVP